MSNYRRSQSPEPESKPPARFSYRMGSRERFIPMNMREGRAARLIHSAITLCKWAKSSVQDVDCFLAFESAYSLIADDLDDMFCPHNTIVQIFYTSFRKNELAQFRWFLHGVQFPRKFSHPIAHQERHGAALAIFPQIIDDDVDLRRYLLFAQADEVGLKIGIDFLEIPAKRIGFHDMDDYVTNFPSHNFDDDDEDVNNSPSLFYPSTPQLIIHDKLPKTEPKTPELNIQELPPSIRGLLNAIHAQQDAYGLGEPTDHAYTLAPSTSTRPSHLVRTQSKESSSNTIYGDSTTDPMHPDAYDW
jgi:hypothetical protein